MARRSGAEAHPPHRRLPKPAAVGARLAVAPVTWRDGVHVTDTSIWCDARRRRAVCFVSSADRVAHADHGQLIATADTLALLATGAPHLAVPLRRPFTLGTLRLELIASGRTRGAAALSVDVGSRTVLYAGAVRTRDTDEPAEVRGCDVVVVAAPLGLPEHRLPRREAVAAELLAWLGTREAARSHSALVVDSASDGLELATQLTAAGISLACSRAITDAAARLGDAPPQRLRGARVLVRTARERGRSDERLALVSPRVLDGARGFAAGFAWPFYADRAELLAWIAATGARAVYVTGTYAEAVAAAVGTRGAVLGPPRQIELFPR